jgi:hypothetical protein
MFCIENDGIRLVLDDGGNLIELTNRRTGQNYAGGRSLWRLIYQEGEAFENQLLAEEVQPEIRCDGHRMTIVYPSRFPVQVGIELVDDEVRWAIDVSNDQPGTVVREIHFPMIGACHYKQGQAMIWGVLGGQRFSDLRAELKKFNTQYMACDHKNIRMSTLYPGSWTATNSYLLADDREGLYFGSHDSTFQQTLHLFELEGENVSAGFVKYPYLRTGEKTHIDGYVVSPYSGSWHVAARKYRSWADQWFKVVDKPDWVKTMEGWQRIILKHQYREIHYRYDQLKQIYDEGHAAGIQNFLLFGWTQDGHDNNYPDFRCDESQGGEASLEKNIRAFQDAGGKVMLYFNGHLIDKTSKYYSLHGAKVCAKDFQGNEYQECYRFGGAGTALRQFGHKTFVGACPTQTLWLDQLKAMADIAFRLNCDGLFFDQMGGWDNVQCCDPTHGHRIPLTTIGQAKADLLAKLREYIKTKNPNISFGTEILCDLTAQHVDYVHNLWGACPEPGPATADGKRPESIGFIDWFRYIFPEVILTDRDIRDDTDIERRVNHALLKGLRSDIEIYRCRRTIAETPHYCEYLKQINRLREKYADLILAGRYGDTDGFTLSNDTIDARAFTNGNRLAVILTQSYLEQTSTVLDVPGHRYVEHNGVGKFTVSAKTHQIQIDLNKHGLVVIVFENTLIQGNA